MSTTSPQRDLARRIAKEFGGPWHEVPDTQGWNPQITDGITTLLFSQAKDNGRTYVSPSMIRSQHSYRSADRPSITVANGRRPDAIAADIRRRLLPDAIAWQQDERDRIARMDADKAAREKARDRLAEILDETGHFPRRDDGRASWYGPSGTHGHAEASLDGTSYSFELSGIPPHAAVRIAATLAALGAGKVA